MASRQGREELIKKGLLEMMEQGECGGRPGGRGARPGNVEPGVSWTQGPRQDGMAVGRLASPGGRARGGLHGWGSPRVLTYGLGPGASEPSSERKATPAPWGAELSLTSLGSL